MTDAVSSHKSTVALRECTLCNVQGFVHELVNSTLIQHVLAAQCILITTSLSPMGPST